MGKVAFEDIALKEFAAWMEKNPKIWKKLSRLILEVRRDPFCGTGKPEPLKGNFSGYWSRRITKEHRLVYRVEGDTLEIISCMDHYED